MIQLFDGSGFKLLHHLIDSWLARVVQWLERSQSASTFANSGRQFAKPTPSAWEDLLEDELTFAFLGELNLRFDYRGARAISQPAI